MSTSSAFREMADRWPSTVVARREVPRFTGGSMSAGHLANEDSRGTGPRNRFRIGKVVAYPVVDLVEWLEQKTKRVEDGAA